MLMPIYGLNLHMGRCLDLKKWLQLQLPVFLVGFLAGSEKGSRVQEISK